MNSFVLPSSRDLPAGSRSELRRAAGGVHSRTPVLLKFLVRLPSVTATGRWRKRGKLEERLILPLKLVIRGEVTLQKTPSIRSHRRTGPGNIQISSPNQVKSLWMRRATLLGGGRPELDSHSLNKDGEIGPKPRLTSKRCDDHRQVPAVGYNSTTSVSFAYPPYLRCRL